ncbi:MAG: SPL family radical SAM protein [Nitrospirota bacterium]
MYSVKLIKERRKSNILKPPAFGCLKGTPAINITRGCFHSCVYCYARGFTDAPPRGEVHLYENLPEMLERELARKRRLPSWVSFCTASDAFQDMDEILNITYAVMNLLIERGIGISFLTKGFIPSEFLELFRRYPHLIKARIGLVSLNEDYIRLFEPFSTHPIKRLLNIRNLINAGVDTAVRIDPVISAITDSKDSMEHLIKRLKVAGVINISVSSLVMRPSIMSQFITELPFKIAKEILRLYNNQPWQRVITSAKTRLLPQAMRIAQYRSIKNIANQYGINCHICGCKNPDLPWEFCNPWISEKDALNINNRQCSLFA